MKKVRKTKKGRTKKARLYECSERSTRLRSIANSAADSAADSSGEKTQLSMMEDMPCGWVGVLEGCEQWWGVG